MLVVTHQAPLTGHCANPEAVIKDVVTALHTAVVLNNQEKLGWEKKQLCQPYLGVIECLRARDQVPAPEVSGRHEEGCEEDVCEAGDGDQEHDGRLLQLPPPHRTQHGHHLVNITSDTSSISASSFTFTA